MFQKFIAERNAASDIFQHRFGRRLSIESARKRFKLEVQKDMETNIPLRGKAKNIHEVLAKNKCDGGTNRRGYYNCLICGNWEL